MPFVSPDAGVPRKGNTMANQQQPDPQQRQGQQGSATERKTPNFDNNNNSGKSMSAGNPADRNGVAPEKPENLGHDPKFDNIQANGQKSAPRGGNQNRS